MKRAYIQTKNVGRVLFNDVYTNNKKIIVLIHL